MTRIFFSFATYFTYTLLYIYNIETPIIYTILKHQNKGSGRKVSNFTVFQQIILACYNPSPYGMSGFRRENQAKIC